MITVQSSPEQVDARGGAAAREQDGREQQPVGVGADDTSASESASAAAAIGNAALTWDAEFNAQVRVSPDIFENSQCDFFSLLITC